VPRPATLAVHARHRRGSREGGAPPEPRNTSGSAGWRGWTPFNGVQPRRSGSSASSATPPGGRLLDAALAPAGTAGTIRPSARRGRAAPPLRSENRRLHRPVSAVRCCRTGRCQAPRGGTGAGLRRVGTRAAAPSLPRRRELRRMAPAGAGQWHAGHAGLLSMALGEALGLPVWDEPGVRATVMADGDRALPQLDDLHRVRMTAVRVRRMVVVASVSGGGGRRRHPGHAAVNSALLHGAACLVGSLNYAVPEKRGPPTETRRIAARPESTWMLGLPRASCRRGPADFSRPEPAGHTRGAGATRT
jgi:hypothetical protein